MPVQTGDLTDNVVTVTTSSTEIKGVGVQGFCSIKNEGDVVVYVSATSANVADSATGLASAGLSLESGQTYTFDSAVFAEKLYAVAASSTAVVRVMYS